MISLRGPSLLGLALGLGLSVAIAVGPSGRARAEEPVATVSNQLSPALLRGPSLYETGRVGKMGLSEAGVHIRQTRSRTLLQEPRVQPKTELASSSQTQPGPRPGAIDADVLAREIRSRFALLKDCKVEVARHRKVAPTAITASRITLRWTIRPDGEAAETQVVATSRIDGRVMNCVKRQMSRWSFSQPIGGPVRVERPFSFR